MATQNIRTMPPASCRRNIHVVPRRTVQSGQIAEPANGASPRVLHFLPPQNGRARYLQFHSFDEAYLARLRAGDSPTQEHFSAYFTALIKIKLGSRLRSPEAIEDVRQETFARFFVALREGKILQADRLGSFVNSICNNVLLEHYRADTRSTPFEDEEEKSVPAPGPGIFSVFSAKEQEQKVRQILDKLPERDRRLLREVFLEERDKDEVCRTFGVDREYLRVLLHRAKQAFKATYLKNSGGNPPDFASAWEQ